jgi:hypothetical protein
MGLVINIFQECQKENTNGLIGDAVQECVREAEKIQVKVSHKDW